MVTLFLRISKGAYMPAKGVGTYAPPIEHVRFFDLAVLSDAAKPASAALGGQPLPNYE
jgi:hypothetical protein